MEFTKFTVIELTHVITDDSNLLGKIFFIVIIFFMNSEYFSYEKSLSMLFIF